MMKTIREQLLMERRMPMILDGEQCKVLSTKLRPSQMAPSPVIILSDDLVLSSSAHKSIIV